MALTGIEQQNKHTRSAAWYFFLVSMQSAGPDLSGRIMILGRLMGSTVCLPTHTYQQKKKHHTPARMCTAIRIKEMLLTSSQT